MYYKSNLDSKVGKRCVCVYLQINIQVAVTINVRSVIRLNGMHKLYFGLQFLGFLKSSLLFKDLDLKKFYC